MTAAYHPIAESAWPNGVKSSKHATRHSRVAPHLNALSSIVHVVCMTLFGLLVCLVGRSLRLLGRGSGRLVLVVCGKRRARDSKNAAKRNSSRNAYLHEHGRSSDYSEIGRPERQQLAPDHMYFI